MTFILYTIVYNQISIRLVIDQRSGQFPDMAGRMPLSPLIVIHRVVTRVLQVIREIRTRIIDRRANQILDILSFGYHA